MPHDICHYWYFLDKGFKFQADVSNRFHDVLMSVNFNNIAILNISGIDYCCIIDSIIKSNTINLLQNVDLSDDDLSKKCGTS